MFSTLGYKLFPGFGSNTQGGASFSPGSLTAVKYWLNAGTITGVSDGGAVTAAKWVDQSLSANGALAAATALTYRASGPNSKPTVEFDGSTSLATSPTFASLNTPRRIFCVFKNLDNTQGSKYFLDGQATNTNVMALDGSNSIFWGFDSDGSGNHKWQGGELTNPAYVADGLYNGASTTITSNNEILITNSGGPSAAITAITLGAPGGHNAGFFAHIQISELIVCDSTLTGPQATQIYGYLYAKYALTTKKLFIGDGDSLTFGTGSSVPGGSSAYPGQLQLLLAGGATTWIIQNQGSAGTTISQIDSNAAALTDPICGYYTRTVIAGWGGTNDLGNGSTGAATYTALQTYFANRRASNASSKLVAMTIIARGDGSWTGAMETERLAFNTSLRNNHAFADGFVDLANDTRLQTPSNTTYYAGDQLHLVDAGYGVVASLMQPVIDAFG